MFCVFSSGCSAQ